MFWFGLWTYSKITWSLDSICIFIYIYIYLMIIRHKKWEFSALFLVIGILIQVSIKVILISSINGPFILRTRLFFPCYNSLISFLLSRKIICSFSFFIPITSQILPPFHWHLLSIHTEVWLSESQSLWYLKHFTVYLCKETKDNSKHPTLLIS